MKLKSPAKSETKWTTPTNRRQDKGVSGNRFLLFGRRKEIRRFDDYRQTSYSPDHYSLRVFSVIISIILLSITDAVLTLYLIRHGASEINPIMEHFLKFGPLPFLAAKYLLTTASVVLLLKYKNAHVFGTKIRAKYLFVIILLIYISVVLWEMFLIFFVVNYIDPEKLSPSMIWCWVWKDFSTDWIFLKG
jgi:hypothetical protein